MNNIKRFMRFVKPHKIKFFASFFFAGLYTLSRASQPFLIGLILSRLARDIPAGNGVDFQYIGYVLIGLISTGLIDIIGEYFSDYVIADAIESSMGDVRKGINKKVHKLPVSYFDSHLQGDILGRITTDVDVVGNAMHQGVNRTIGSILTLTFSVVFMFIRSTFFTLIVLFVFPICIYLFKHLTKKSQPSFDKLQNTLGDLNGYTTEYYSGYEVVQLFGQENKISEKFRGITTELADAAYKSNFISSSINPILSFVTHLFYIGLFFAMGSTVLNGPIMIGGFVLASTIDVGVLQSFIQYVWQAGGPIRDITQLSNVFQAAGSSLSRIYEFLDETEETKDIEGIPLDLEAVKGKVDFKNVKFGYEKDKPLMKDISIDVKSGQMVAVVGHTGAGKTTLINLLMRFYGIDGGAITIDDIDIKEMSRKQTRAMFGMVLQDPWLYKDTIRENIRFGWLEASNQDVVTAAKLANVHRYIRTLPHGYDTIMNEESSNISQGQKQLLTIARALVGNPRIVILDEATSSVDTRLEMQIQKAMATAMENRTSFVIAHRLSTIRDADLILVMENGSIVEQGTHDELMQKGDSYYQLYNSQFTEAEE